MAKELTEGLRSRAKAGMGPFMLQPGSEKELIDEKLLKNCENEAVACMSQIGTDLGADVLMYGKIEKKGGSYEVTITLLDIRNRGKKAFPTQIPVSQSTGASIQGWAKTIYNKLTGQADSGQVIVKLSVNESGTILIDDAPKGNITGGTGTASNVTPGKHHLVIQVGGYKDWSKDIDVKEGQATNVGVDTLERDVHGPGTGSGSGSGSGSNVVELPPPPPPGGGDGGGGSGLKFAIGGAVVGLAGGAWWIYNYTKISDTQNQICKLGGYVPEGTTILDGMGQPIKDSMGQNAVGHYTGGTPPVQCTVTSAGSKQQLNDLESQGHSHSIQTGVGIGVVVVGALGIVWGVTHLRSGHSSNEHAARGRKVHRDPFVITPVISPNGGGATLQFDF